MLDVFPASTKNTKVWASKPPLLEILRTRQVVGFFIIQFHLDRSIGQYYVIDMTIRDTKQAIIESTITLLGREGADGFSASALAKEVGISKATIFHHFQTLDEIPVAALDLLTKQALEFDMPEGLGPKELGLAEFLDMMGEMAFGFLETRRGFLNAYFTFVSKAMFNPRLKEKMQTSLNGAKAQVHALVKTHVEDEARSRDLTNIIMMTLDGGMMHVLLLDNTAEAQSMWARLSTLLVLEFENENRN